MVVQICTYSENQKVRSRLENANAACVTAARRHEELSLAPVRKRDAS